jgi:hypothetical protein
MFDTSRPDIFYHYYKPQVTAIGTEPKPHLPSPARNATQTVLAASSAHQTYMTNNIEDVQANKLK